MNPKRLADLRFVQSLPVRDRVRHRPSRVAKTVTSSLYLSHLLSTWGGRMSEYSCVFFLAFNYPGTLFYVSVYNIARCLAVVLLSSWIGAYIDEMDRLAVVRTAIVLQRIPMALACMLFVVLTKWNESPTIAPTIFVLITLLGCVEKLASVTHVVALERDWVVEIADAFDLRRQDLNAKMRRIDIGSKVFVPFFFSLLDTVSTKLAMWATMNMTIVLAGFELYAISRITSCVPELSVRPKTIQLVPLARKKLEPLRTLSTNKPSGPSPDEMTALIAADDEHTDPTSSPGIALWTTKPWREYASSPVFLPSISNAILYLTVLSFSGQMITYLLSTGFGPLDISMVRFGTVMAELASTWAAPLLMYRVGPVRAGLWFLLWQVACVTVFMGSIMKAETATKTIGIYLAIGITFKRIGLWGSDLSAQYLVQETIPSSSRGRFSAAEMACQNLFEVVSSTVTTIFTRPDQIKYPVTVSYAAIICSAACYMWFVRNVRGHLLHVARTA